MKFLISKPLAKYSLISPRAGKKPAVVLRSSGLAHSSHPCDLWCVLLWPYAHLAACLGLTGIVVICAGSFQWWNCIQSMWNKVFLQERAASSSTTAPHTVISSFSTKLSLGWGDTRIKKKKKNMYSHIKFFKNKTIHIQEYWEHPLLFFLIVFESSIKVNFHSQEKNTSQLLPPHLHTGHAQGV